MRDALSLLDQVISFSDDKVSFEQAIQVSGSLTDDLMIEFVRLLTQQQSTRQHYYNCKTYYY